MLKNILSDSDASCDLLAAMMSHEKLVLKEEIERGQAKQKTHKNVIFLTLA